MKKRVHMLCVIALLSAILLCGCGSSVAKENNSRNMGQVSQKGSEHSAGVGKNTEAAKTGHTETEPIGENGTEASEEEDSRFLVSAIEEFTMFFTGDILLKEAAVADYNTEGLNSIISEYLESEMNTADLTMVNQEFPFSTRGTQAPDKQFTFRINPSYVSVFQDMGVDVVSLANNHALDYGKEALLDSFAALDNAGIPYVGAGETKERAEEAVFVERGGRTVGVLSASRVIPVVGWNIENEQPGLFCTYDSTRLVQRIKETKAQCDYVVVYVHWGVERETYPEEYQRQLAKEYIDAGADLVVGNHAHVPQGIEYYKGVPIVYCLGNFIFNQNMADTYALKVLWDKDGKTTLQILPVGIANYDTYELKGQERSEFMEYLESISFDVSIDEDGYVSEAAE
uniref:CapA family protein n=1 Tax=Agathobacter sp. TaxID=2021311 RepID=UPI004055C38B